MRYEVKDGQLRIFSPIGGSSVARRITVVNENESPKTKLLMDIIREQMAEMARLTASVAEQSQEVIRLNNLSNYRSGVIDKLSADLEQKLVSLTKLREALATKPVEGSHTPGSGNGLGEQMKSLTRRVDALEKSRPFLYIQGEEVSPPLIDTYSPISVGPFKVNAVVGDSEVNLILAEEKGYCVISRSACWAARIDRTDWKQVMADSHVGGMDWVRALGSRAADHYRRVYSKDKIVIPVSWLKRLVNSENGPTGYRAGEGRKNRG